MVNRTSVCSRYFCFLMTALAVALRRGGWLYFFFVVLFCRRVDLLYWQRASRAARLAERHGSKWAR